MPANTGTNHTAILTSSYAGSHGILGVGGYFKELDKTPPPRSKKYGVPIASMYKHRHLQVPTFYNVIKENNPEMVTAFISGKTWLRDIIPDDDCDINIPPKDVEGYVLGGLAHPEDNEIPPRLYIPKKGEREGKEPPWTFNIGFMTDADFLPSDKWVIDQAIECVNRHNPDFMYLVLMNMDIAGHAYGAFSADKEQEETNGKNLTLLRNPNASRDQLHITDSEIGRFLQHLKRKKLYKSARIIITSDHGMNTTKSVLSDKTWRELKDWLRIQNLARPNRIAQNDWAYGTLSGFFEKLKNLLHRIKPKPPKEKVPTPIEPTEKLVIDIRRILAYHGIEMRASQGTPLHRYNEKGRYDWCFSDGGAIGYIFNADSKTQEEIKKILENHKIREDGEERYPIWKVLTEENMDELHLEKGDFDANYDAQWPSVIVFLKPHYMIPMYNDQLKAKLTPIMAPANLPGFIDWKISGGLHGTYSEQNVPLIFKTSDEKLAGKIRREHVSVLDIIPTINHLNGWPEQKFFEGKSLL
jgi:hypothetical protein